MDSFKGNRFRDALNKVVPIFKIYDGYKNVASLVFLSIVGLLDETSDDKKLAKESLEALKKYGETTPTEFIEMAEMLYDIEIKRKRPSKSEFQKLNELNDILYDRKDFWRSISCGITDKLNDYSQEYYDGPLIVGC